MSKGVNSNVSWDTSFPFSVVFTPATLPLKQTVQAAAKHKQEVKSLNLNLSNHTWSCHDLAQPLNRTGSTSFFRIFAEVARLWLLPFRLLFFLLSPYRPRSEFAYKLPCRRAKQPPHPCSYPSNTADPLSRGEASMVRMNSGRLGEISNVEVSWGLIEIFRHRASVMAYFAQKKKKHALKFPGDFIIIKFIARERAKLMPTKG